MRYYAPTTIEEAVAVLERDEDARCLAGGATLVAMLNADLLVPSALVSLRHIENLDRVTRSDTGFAIGAMTRHAAVAAESQFVGGLAVVRQAAQEIGHPAIRAVGTIGGAVAHADPSADYPTALVATNADIEIAGRAGSRMVAASEFFEDFYTTAIKAGELVSAIHLRTPAPGSVSVYRKVARSDGDFAIAALAFCGQFDGEKCIAARVTVGGCAAKPVNVAAVDALLVGSALGDSRIADAANALAAACDPIDDVRGSADYRRELVRRLLPDALRAAHRTASV